MASTKKAVLLINVGTPDSPSVKDVRKYLFRFLNDRRVIDLPWLLQKILVNLVIVPFRAPKSAKLYRLLWTDKGSPLLVHSNQVRDSLQDQLGSNYKVFVAMRYGNPNLKKILDEIHSGAFARIIVLPMFPQYASSSTGTAIAAVMDQVKMWNIIPEIKFVGQFYSNPGFIDSFAQKIKQYEPGRFDHIIFSYHGLPVRQISRVHPGVDCQTCTCNRQLPAQGAYCYKATCYETTRLIASQLGLQKDDYSLSFQSRLSDKWLKPFTDKVLVQKANEGVQKLLIVAPAFVADCLETSVEIGIDYKNMFIKAGGSDLEYVESLNDMPGWVDVLKDMILNA
jgi:protoporphyrin/coproporphyrin ferrochelatase